MPGKIVHFELRRRRRRPRDGVLERPVPLAGRREHDGGLRLPDVPDRRRPGRRDLPVREAGSARRSSTSTPTTSTRRSRRCASSAARPRTSSPSRRTAGSRRARTRRATASASGRATRTPLDAASQSLLTVLAGPRRLGAGRGDGPLRRPDRRDRGAHVLDRRAARCSRVADPRRRAHGLRRARRARSERPPWMWLGGLMGLIVVGDDHVRPAAHRRDGDDRDPDRGPARDGRA